MAAVFIEGLIFLAITVAGLRTKFAMAIPQGYVCVCMCVRTSRGAEESTTNTGCACVYIFLKLARPLLPYFLPSLSFFLPLAPSFFPSL